MPRYILHGGATRIENDANKQFFAQMASDIPAGGTWLGIYFARPDLDGENTTFERDIPHFKIRVPERTDIKFILATEANWHQEILKADCVYLAGGNTQKLQQTLMTVPNARELFMLDKTYSGSSAGMYVLGRDSLDSVDETGELVRLESLNILPYGMVAHYGAPEYHATQANLGSRKRPLLMLAETQFVVIEQ